MSVWMTVLFFRMVVPLTFDSFTLLQGKAGPLSPGSIGEAERVDEKETSYQYSNFLSITVTATYSVQDGQVEAMVITAA